MPACGDCAKLFLPWIWNGFVHISLFQDCLFLSISNKPFKWINSNLAIILLYIYGITIPRNTNFSFKKFKTHFTHSKSNQIIYERWMTIEWCWKTLTRKYFLFQNISWFCVFDFYCQFESLKCNRLHVWILGEIIRASFLLDVHLCKNDDSWPQ